MPLNKPPSARAGNVSRRQFLRNAAAGAAVLSAPAALKSGQTASTASAKPGPFKLKYAPSLGMFAAHAGKDPLDQLKFYADQGFRAFFDNGLMNRPPAEQEAIAREAKRLGLDAGPFVAYADFSAKSFVVRDPAVREMLAGRLKQAVACAKRTGVKQTLMVPGRYDESLEWDYQTANVIESLKWAAGVCEPEGMVVVIEPLNPHDHPGLFLSKMPQAYQIVKAVGSPACKIIEDFYHQQITEGNLIPNLERCYDEIAAFHIGDNPGRKEPGTGEINYRSIFKRLRDKGCAAVLGMEHGVAKPGRDGERAVLEAYRACDDF